ncbi:MAG: hypothetical protein WDW38_004907 [Sanguina aurantia]
MPCLYNLCRCVSCLLPLKVDAFTTTPLHGNPAAVMLLGRGSAVTATDTLLQAIAAENNLPETAFIQEIEASHEQPGLEGTMPPLGCSQDPTHTTTAAAPDGSRCAVTAHNQIEVRSVRKGVPSRFAAHTVGHGTLHLHQPVSALCESQWPAAEGAAGIGNTTCTKCEALLRARPCSLPSPVHIQNPAFLAQVTGSGSSGGSSPHASTSPFTSNHTFGLRWFTPVCEVPLCGHATLAAAAVLFSGMDNPSPVIHFRTASGTLSITKVDSPATQQQPDAQDPTTTTTSTIITTSLTATHGDHLPAAASWAVAVAGGGGGRGDRALQLEMSLPLAALTETPAVLQRGGPGGDGACVQALLAACVGDLVVEHIGFTSALGLNYLMLVLAPGTTQQQLRDMRPDTAAMMLAVSKSVVSGVVVTLHEDDSEFDFVSRFFGPWMGITEDPVTGSAHTVLGPYWADRLGKTTLSARQCSARGGELTVRVDESAGRVLITGSAVIVIRGSFTC